MKNCRSAIQQRQNELIKYLKENESADVATLAAHLDISPVTVRRDLEELEKRGSLIRYFGGARLSPNVAQGEDCAYMKATTQHLAEKKAIAKCAAEYLENGDTVFINSSSTAMLIYPYIQNKNVLIVTNNGRSLLSQRAQGVDLVLTGGEVYGHKHSLVGQFALDTLSRITATKCILGVSGISVQGGITSSIIQETAINKMMLRRCNGPRIIVADSTKVGIEHKFYSGTLNDVTNLITDTHASTLEISHLRQAGINVDIVEPLVN